MVEKPWRAARTPKSARQLIAVISHAATNGPRNGPPRRQKTQMLIRRTRSWKKNLCWNQLIAEALEIWADVHVVDKAQSYHLWSGVEEALQASKSREACVVWRERTLEQSAFHFGLGHPLCPPTAMTMSAQSS
jgi:hypothetical protein